MNKNIIKIAVILALGTIAYVGYYLYLGNNANQPSSAEYDLSDMQAKAAVFMEHRRILDAVKMDLTLFSDQRFDGLEDQSLPLGDYSVGRDDPFSDLSNF